ncbi:MAG: acyltransferase [bacterium]
MASHKEHIPSLDGLRAVSILLVFVSHCNLEHLVPGGLGVTLFFFLSGFLITTLLRQEFESRGRISLRNFYLRRIFRIWPPFYLVLLVSAALTLLGVLPGHVSCAGLTAQLLHFANYNLIWFQNAIPVGTGVYWSLAIEEHFYLLFPMLYILLCSRGVSVRRQAAILAAICGAILVWRCWLVFGLHVANARTYYASDTRFDNILYGCLLAIAANPVMDRQIVADKWMKYVFFPAGIGLLLVTLLVRNDSFRETLRYSLQGVAMVPILVAAIRFPEWTVFRWLNYRWISFLGVISYSLYLVHQTVIITVQQRLPLHPALQGLIAFLLAISITIALHAAVERPFAKLRKRFR